MVAVVAYKWAANPQDATVSTDGVVDWSRAHAAISEDDPIAMQVGRAVADAAGTELVGISVGTTAVAAPAATKAALSRGLDRAIILADDTTAEWNATRVGHALATLVSRIPDASILLTAGASIDENAGLIQGVVGGYLGWPVFDDVQDVQPADGGWVITQSIPGGTRTVQVTGPVVAAVASDALPLRIPGMKDILAAGKKPVEKLTIADLDGATPASPTAAAPATTTVVNRRAPEPTPRRREIFSGATAIDDLAAVIKELA